MTEQQRMLSGQLYMASDPELVALRKNARQVTERFNTTPEAQSGQRMAILQGLFASIGENFFIEPPFRCDYGCNISIGKRFCANFGCIILDICPVTIGDNVMFGPRVSIYAASHPIDPAVRNSQLECGAPVSIGNSVWIGGNTVINPGVHIGSNVVIGSGSVVTKDIPDNVIAAGCPCRVLRPITQADTDYWQQQANLYWESHQ